MSAPPRSDQIADGAGIAPRTDAITISVRDPSNALEPVTLEPVTRLVIAGRCRVRAAVIGRPRAPPDHGHHRQFCRPAPRRGHRSDSLAVARAECTENVAKETRGCSLLDVSTSEPEGTADSIQWLSTAEAANRLGITPRTLYRFIDEGQLAAYRFGRVIRLKTSDVDAFIDACRIEPGTLEHLYPDSAAEISTTDANAT